MDLYILRDWNVGIDACFDAGSGAAGWNAVPYNVQEVSANVIKYA